MKVIKARVLGFCMGVRRAVDLAVEEAGKAAKEGNPIYTLGPLIHNPKVLDDLKAIGIQVINESPLTSCCPLLTEKCTVIIRAHGISPALESDLRGRGCRIADATCPKVKANQLKTRELIEAGYFLFLAGEERHAEIEGLLGYTGNLTLQNGSKDDASANCIIAGSAEEALNAAEKLSYGKKLLKTALLGQTTISEEEYINIGNEIKKFFPTLEIVNTICAATGERQNALREILPLADAVIVAGGEESANTRRLLAIAKESGKPCALAENAAGVPEEFFSFETVGICAGASTPDSVVDGIERILKNNS